MAQAYIIECGDDDAGIVTRETRGFLFHAADRTYRRLEGRTFETLRKAQLAAEALRREKLASQNSQELRVLSARTRRAI
jgi:hypothetical protein